MYRQCRVVARQLARVEPVVRREMDLPLEFHGSETCGWWIPSGFLRADSVVIDVGLGEDISFSKSLIDAYGCRVHGFDPTPQAIAHVESLGYQGFTLHKYGLAGKRGRATFHLPINGSHVSGSLIQERHVGRRQIEVQLITVGDLFEIASAERIDLLKMDIEGAEYGVISSPEFAQRSPHVRAVNIEFHHRWEHCGKQATLDAVARLRELGFRCAWRSRTSNEEFLFVNASLQTGA